VAFLPPIATIVRQICCAGDKSGVVNGRRAPWEELPAEAFEALTPLLPALTEEIIAAIRAEVPAYARPLEGAFGQAVSRGVAEALAQFADMARHPGIGRGGGRRVYVALGRGEARAGRSLEALLAAYRVGARVAWRRAAEAGLAAGLAPETLVLLAEAIFAYIDELSAESAEGFAREQAEQAGEVDRRRAALLDTLLREPPAAPDALAAAADAAGWTLPQRLAVVVWPAGRGARAARRLPLGAFAAPAGGHVCAVVPDPGAPGRRAEVETALAGAPGGMGPTVDPADAARSHRRAVAALALAEERGEPGLLRAAEHRADLLARADPGLVAEIRDERLRGLAGETEASRHRLQDTLLAWLRHAGDVRAAAAELHVHPQTVRYRLARLRHLLGPQMDDPDARLELHFALRTASKAR
jgi:hypothetical protein